MIKIHGKDWEILRVLYENRKIKITNSFLIELLKFSKWDVSKILSSLQLANLITREGRLINLTKQGNWYAKFYLRVRTATAEDASLEVEDE